MSTREKTLIAVLIVVIIAVIGFQFFDWRGRSQEMCQKEREKEKQKWEGVVAGLEAQIATLRTTPPDDTTGAPEEEVQTKIPADLFASGIALIGEAEPPTCGDLAVWIDRFFEYLDRQDYIQSMNLENGSRAQYNLLMKMVSRKVPIATEMVLDFDIILQNIIHFYQVLGENNLEEVKLVVDQEAENLEAILIVFHQYATLCDQALEEAGIVVPSLKVRYEYASFFLNTIGGRSYLYRRDSRTRILLTYYAILTLHEANQEVLNRHGIDLVFYLEPLIEEIAARDDLTLKEAYLETLGDLAATYAAARSWDGEATDD